jgi:DNA-binding PadR family transcriptional regulator
MTNAEIAVLGLVAEKPRYGYELNKAIKEKGIHYWTEIGFSSIYFVLTRLEEKELVESRIESQDSVPSRKVYSVTKKGKKELKGSIMQILSHPKRRFSDVDLGMSNLMYLNREEALSCFKSYLGQLTGEESELKDFWQTLGGEDLPFYMTALFTRPLMHRQVEIEWVKEFIDKLEARPEWVSDLSQGS